MRTAGPPVDNKILNLLALEGRARYCVPVPAHFYF